MSLSFIPLGGFGEVGKNCLAVRIDDDLIILDAGVHLENYVSLTGHDFFKQKHVFRKLVNAQAIPDLRPIKKYLSSLRAVFCSHGHLDHIGALPFFSKKFRCPVYATPYTASLIRSFCKDHKASLNVIAVSSSSTIRISPKLSVEFIHVAHSIPQSSILALHTPYGVVLYANDYKNDQTPPFDEPTDIPRLKELSGKVNTLLIDSLYAQKEGLVPSEELARQELLSLKESLSSHRAIIVSTFSSHISRLQSICDLADSLGREVVFLGRSLTRYALVAKETGVVNLFSRAKFLSYARQVNRFLQNISSPEKYLIVVTGHQGEPGAVLDRMSKGEFSFTPQDVVVFSCSIIPTPQIISQRAQLEHNLKKQRVRIISDVHASGHGHSQDIQELISLLQPKNLIPSHADKSMQDACISQAKKLGYSLNDSSHKIITLQSGKQTNIFD